MEPSQPFQNGPVGQPQPPFPPTPAGAPVGSIINPTVVPNVPIAPNPPVNEIGVNTDGLFQSSAPSFGVVQPPVPQQPIYPAPKSRRKLLLILIPLLVIFFGASAAAYFVLYLPAQPDNLWKTALSNTGKGYDKLSSYIAQTKPSKGYAIDGSFKSTGTVALDGTIAGTSDGKNGQLTGTVSAVGVKVNFDVREMASAATTPDIYFKVDGLQGLGSLLGGGDAQYTSALNGINNQWYFIDHSLFDQFAQGANTNLQISSDDVSSVLKAVGDASKQYIFTGDTAKMVAIVKQKVGKETQDGRSVYHFKVGLNKNNLSAYIKALCTDLKASKLNKFFGGSSDAVNQALNCDSLEKQIQKGDYTGNADAWVDLQTKLIHKIRITDKASKDNYLDISQNYVGGQEFPFSLGFHSKDSGSTTTGLIKIILNMKTNAVGISGNITSSGGDNFGATFNISVSPNSSPVKVEKPAGAKTFIELLGNLGLGDAFGGTDSSASPPITVAGRDTERKTDINAMAGQIEAYQAQNGTYPSLINLNDSTWLDSNLLGLDLAALQDPSGADQKIVSSPKANAYSYSPTPAGCDNGSHSDCSGYTLTATLEAGGTYVKQDLNGPTSI